MIPGQLRVAEYRVRAEEATALALESSLERVRERHEAAAARWHALASLIERGPRLRAARPSKTPVEPQCVT